MSTQYLPLRVGGLSLFYAGGYSSVSEITLIRFLYAMTADGGDRTISSDRRRAAIDSIYSMRQDGSA